MEKAGFLMFEAEGAVVGIGALFRVGNTLLMGEMEVRIVFSPEQVKSFLDENRAQMGDHYNAMLHAAQRATWPLGSDPPNAVRLRGYHARVVAGMLISRMGSREPMTATSENGTTILTNAAADALRDGKDADVIELRPKRRGDPDVQ